MIALITSTLRPSNNTHTFFDENERYSQSIETIKKLATMGFSEMFMFDNSATKIDAERLMQDSGHNLHFFQTSQYTFRNKGLNEALLILNSLNQLPADLPIFKISARYYPNTDFNSQKFINSNVDFMGRGYDFAKKTGLFSTRGYFVRNKEVLEKILVLAIEDMLAYGKGIYGLKSAIYQMKSIISLQPGSPFQISIEHAFARIIKTQFSYQLFERIGIEGFIAGADRLDHISE